MGRGWLPAGSGDAAAVEDDRARGERLARLSTRHRELFYRLCFRTALVVSLVFTLAPLYYLLAVAVTPNTAAGALVPPTVSPEGFRVAWGAVDWARAFLNTALVTVGTLALVLGVAVPAAYAFARFEFPGRRPLFVATLALFLFPKQGFAVALFSMFTTPVDILGVSVRLYNTRPGIVLPLAAYRLPLAVGLLTVFFASVPDDLERAARVEGATRYQAFRHAVLPLASPGVVSVAVFVYVSAYTENFFTWFMTFGANDAGYTVTNTLHAMGTGTVVYPNAVAAAGLVGLVPSALVLLFVAGRLDSWLSEWGALTE